MSRFVLLLLLPALLGASRLVERAKFAKEGLNLLPQPATITTGDVIRDIKDPCNFKVKLENAALVKLLTPAIDRLLKHTFRAAADFCPQPVAQGSVAEELTVHVKNENLITYTSDVDESYILDVNATNIALTAETFVGVLRGLETFSQLIYYDRNSIDDVPKYYIPKTPVHIDDKPGYKHRGLMLDLSTDEQPSMATIQRIIVGMAALKMNILHLSFSSDTGFTLPTKNNKLPAGTLTEEALQQLRTFALQHGIRVYGSLNIPYYVQGLHGIGKDGLIATCNSTTKPFSYINVINPDAVPAVADVLSQLLEQFPDELSDVGGFKLGEINCNSPQKVEVRKNFIDLLLGTGNFAQSHANKKTVVWMDAPDGFPTKTEKPIYHYYGTTGNATKFLNTTSVEEVILSPLDQFFLACGYSRLVENFECGFRSWLSFYDYNPEIYFGANVAKVRGAEMIATGSVFGEESIINLLFPRMIGLAERLWTRRNAGNVAERVIAQRKRLLARGIHFGPVTNAFCEANVGKCFGSL
eukprot:TRINITY_DN6892_c0_g1_i1.p1 TRINITY_DN6892_c0_g1~~TRINITY_DN6892_c0_g1_i1.p1  ORF type:complete len:526 (-),score=144.36 TRINITY_DN6892_c0_g1_i1:157-1734(-)